MVHFYRGGVYLLMIVAAVLVYLLLRRLFSRRTRTAAVVLTLLTATGLLWGTHTLLAKRALLRKYAPILLHKRTGGPPNLNLIYVVTEARVCNPDGSDDHTFLGTEFVTTRDLTWSPDGSRILACSIVEAGYGVNIYAYDAEGTSRVQLTSESAICRRPCWSPDGEQIVFDYRSNTRQKATELHIMNADGSDRRQLPTPEDLSPYHPVWSHDGGTIYFLVKKNNRDDLWAMNPDGSNLRQLTDTADQSETEPALSPDGIFMVMTINRRELQLLDLRTGEAEPLVSAEGEVCRGRDPSWSPDGRSIYFAGFGRTGFKRSDREQRHIKVYDLETADLRKVAVETGKLLTPVLSPDRSRLAYLRCLKITVRKVKRPSGPAGG